MTFAFPALEHQSDSEFLVHWLLLKMTGHVAEQMCRETVVEQGHFALLLGCARAAYCPGIDGHFWTWRCRARRMRRTFWLPN